MLFTDRSSLPEGTGSVTTVAGYRDDARGLGPAPEFDGGGWKKWLLAAGAVALIFWWWTDPGITHPPGVLVPENPHQYGSTKGAWKFKDYTFTPLADFSVRGLVLSTERYWFDLGAELSPVDFALGWGPMSDQSVIDRLSIAQGGRAYTWRPKGGQPPVPVPEIVSHSANMHLIPADKDVKDRLLAVERGSVVTLEGQLVLVEGERGFKWQSSLTREDTGCEVIWVTRVDVQH